MSDSVEVPTWSLGSVLSWRRWFWIFLLIGLQSQLTQPWCLPPLSPVCCPHREDPRWTAHTSPMPLPTRVHMYRHTRLSADTCSPPEITHPDQAGLCPRPVPLCSTSVPFPPKDGSSLWKLPGTVGWSLLDATTLGFQAGLTCPYSVEVSQISPSLVKC